MAERQDEIVPAREDRSWIYQAGGAGPDWTRPDGPVPVCPGPHLFVDDYLITSSKHVARRVLQPARHPGIPNPLVTGAEDRCFQPFFTVSRSPETGRLRMWYGAWREDRKTTRSHLAYTESDDGICWDRPPRICTSPEIQFGSEVIDEGPDWPHPATRYRYSYWLAGGLRIAVSADGLDWKPLVDGVVLPHDHDINNIWWDPLRMRYVATVSTHMASDRWAGRRRTTMQGYSDDLIHWTPPGYVLYADPARGDEGKTQFYAMNAFLVRGALAIGMVKVLRDDLRAEGVAPDAFGRAHTTLAWSRDGAHWERDQAAFFEPDPRPEAWDHAHAWMDEQVAMGDEVFLYYCGYKQGHKANRFTERQIGLVKMPLDRYVAREAMGAAEGRMMTVPLHLNEKPGQLVVNASASDGALCVAVCDPEGRAIPGLGLEDCHPLTADGLRLPVRWGSQGETERKLAALGGRVVRLAFRLTHARLFAFDFVRT